MMVQTALDDVAGINEGSTQYHWYQTTETAYQVNAHMWRAHRDINPQLTFKCQLVCPCTEEALKKAAKLNPALDGAWNCLGGLFWKRGNLEGARNCYQSVLKRG